MQRNSIGSIFSVAILTLMANVVVAGDRSTTINASAPPETAQLATLLGDWAITDWSLQQDGTWAEAGGAEWHWYTILDGTAIQDDWISPALDQPEPEAGRQFGTNIRIYNPAEQRWEMAWASSNGKKVDTFVATVSDGQLVMTGVFGGRQSRITFFDMTEDSFDWKLEFQNAQDESWLEVYRIHGDRI